MIGPALSSAMLLAAGVSFYEIFKIALETLFVALSFDKSGYESFALKIFYELLGKSNKSSFFVFYSDAICVS